MKAIKFSVLFLFLSSKIFAQDAILISEGNFVRGVIKGTNYLSVAIMEDNQILKEYLAKDIQSFVWNGETYDSKPIVVKKKMEFRFFKLLEIGKVNLYTYGDRGGSEQPVQPRVKVRPSIGIGMGSGGFGGGLGGGVSIGIGGGRRNDQDGAATTKGKVSYFIEKPGTGPMQEVVLENTNSVKTILLQKLTGDDDLAESVKATENFNPKNLAAFIKAYNTHK